MYVSPAIGVVRHGSAGRMFSLCRLISYQQKLEDISRRDQKKGTRDFLWRARLVIDECSSDEITTVVYPGGLRSWTTIITLLVMVMVKM